MFWAFGVQGDFLPTFVIDSLIHSLINGIEFSFIISIKLYQIPAQPTFLTHLNYLATWPTQPSVLPIHPEPKDNLPKSTKFHNFQKNHN